MRIIIFLLLSFHFFAYSECQDHREQVQVLRSQLESLKNRHCFFPRTSERKLCLKTELARELRIQKLARLGLLETCEQSK